MILRTARLGLGRTATDIVAEIAKPGSKAEGIPQEVKSKLTNKAQWVGNGKYEEPKR